MNNLHQKREEIVKKCRDKFERSETTSKTEMKLHFEAYLLQALSEYNQAVVEMVEGMKDNNSCGHDQDGACTVKYGDVCSESFNSALSLLKEKLLLDKK